MMLSDLIARWVQRRDDGDRFGAMVPLFTIACQVLADLEQLSTEQESKVVTLAEASKLGGYSVDRLVQQWRARKDSRSCLRAEGSARHLD